MKNIKSIPTPEHIIYCAFVATRKLINSCNVLNYVRTSDNIHRFQVRLRGLSKIAG